MTRRVRLCFLLPTLAAAACGKKGPPLIPLPSTPQQVAELTVRRLDDEVYIRFKIPVANITGEKPADIRSVVVYAFTGRPISNDDFVKYGTVVAEVPVRKPPPPLPPVKEGETPPPPLPVPTGPGLNQGDYAVVVDKLVPDAYVPIVTKAEQQRLKNIKPAPIVTDVPLLGPPSVLPIRTYVVVGLNHRGRKGNFSARAPVPLLKPPPAPSTPTVTYTARAFTVGWVRPEGARMAAQQTETSASDDAAGTVKPGTDVSAGAPLDQTEPDADAAATAPESATGAQTAPPPQPGGQVAPSAPPPTATPATTTPTATPATTPPTATPATTPPTAMPVTAPPTATPATAPPTATPATTPPTAMPATTPPTSATTTAATTTPTATAPSVVPPAQTPKTPPRAPAATSPAGQTPPGTPGVPSPSGPPPGTPGAPTPADQTAPAVPAGPPPILQSRPLFPVFPPSGFNVYEIVKAEPEERGAPAPAPPPATAGAAPAPVPLVNPVPLNLQPISGESYQDVRLEFGTERCYAVRTLNVFGNLRVESPPTETMCVSPVDTFPPVAPKGLAAVGSESAIDLIWEPNNEADLAGYLVLRGTPGDETLQRLTPSPTRQTTYRDSSVKRGVRYVYVVVAVDKAEPPNVSAPSARVEETAR